MKKTKKITKKTTRKKVVKKSSKKKKWSDQHRAVSHLMEEELQGLIQYLRSIHYIALIMILSSIAILIYALKMLFENGSHAVIAFIAIMITSLTVIFASTLVLRPWVLPRFLLPLDLQDIQVKQLMDLFKDPDEYHELLKNHIQILTENFLIPKLKRLRNALAFFIFGISISLILAIALP
jgi:hypothetical protein